MITLLDASVPEVQDVSITSEETKPVGKVLESPEEDELHPIDTFSGENLDIRFDDWLPALVR